MSNLISRIYGEHFYVDAVTFSIITLPINCVGNAQIAAGAGVAATKLEHRNWRTHAQDSTATATAQTRVIHSVFGATGSIIDFAAGAIMPATGDSTVSIDLQVNGASVLTSPITLDNSQAARETVDAAISSAGLVAGDVVEIVITVSAGTGTLPAGVFATLVFDEDAQ